MHFLSQACLSILEAEFTQGVLSGIAISNPFPRTTILLVHIRRTGVFVILSVHYFLVLFAVCSVCELWTAGVTTGLFRCFGHVFTS